MENSFFKENYHEKYEILKENKIGSGYYTEVYKAKHKQTNELRAIKIIKLDEIREQLKRENLNDDVNKQIEAHKNCLKNEIKNMEICSCKNNNSVKYYESYETQNEFAIVLELCDDSLANLLIKKKDAFNSNEIYNILIQLNNTFKIMKNNKIVHRDLKLDNILINYDDKNNKNKFIVKLCDFGISKIGNYFC